MFKTCDTFHKIKQDLNSNRTIEICFTSNFFLQLIKKQFINLSIYLFKLREIRGVSNIMELDLFYFRASASRNASVKPLEQMVNDVLRKSYRNKGT